MILGKYPDTRTEAERKADADRAFNRGVAAGKKLDALAAGEIQKGKATMSLVGKLNALAERAKDLTEKTGAGLDDLAKKIDATERRRDEALAKHHAYYDAIAKGIDESTAVIDRLSNVPLGGETSQGG